MKVELDVHLFKIEKYNFFEVNFLKTSFESQIKFFKLSTSLSPTLYLLSFLATR